MSRVSDRAKFVRYRAFCQDSIEKHRAVVQSKLVEIAAVEKDTDSGCPDPIDLRSHDAIDGVVSVRRLVGTHAAMQVTQYRRQIALGHGGRRLGWTDGRA